MNELNAAKINAMSMKLHMERRLSAGGSFPYGHFFFSNRFTFVLPNREINQAIIIYWTHPINYHTRALLNHYEKRCLSPYCKKEQRYSHTSSRWRWKQNGCKRRCFLAYWLANAIEFLLFKGLSSLVFDSYSYGNSSVPIWKTNT